MIKGRLPKFINPIRFAEKRQLLKGLVPLADMHRLQALCFAGNELDGSASIWLEGGIDEQGLKYLHGSVEADVPLICHRCLQKMIQHIASEFYLMPVFNEEEASALIGQYESLYLTAQEVKLQNIIEDELILALPLVAKHLGKDCQVKIEKVKETPKTTKSRPFEDLAEKLNKLKRKQ